MQILFIVESNRKKPYLTKLKLNVYVRWRFVSCGLYLYFSLQVLSTCFKKICALHAQLNSNFVTNIAGCLGVTFTVHSIFIVHTFLCFQRAEFHLSGTKFLQVIQDYVELPTQKTSLQLQAWSYQHNYNENSSEFEPSNNTKKI